MPHYQSFDPATEITGLSALSLLKNIMHKDIADIIHRHGLDQIDPNAWYPLQSLLDVLSDISEGENVTSTFVSIGMAAAQPGYDAMSEQMKAMSLGEFLKLYADVYKSRMRHGETGWIKVEQQAKNHYVLTLYIPYPDDVFYGVFYAYTRLFRPAGQGFTVKYDDKTVSREKGGEVTVLHVVVDD
ncbi:MAG: hypothetical protein H7X77_10085 [Anaerolineae bacterium]|nr:hypothetical protein [Anaerolineae bacterium]